MQILDEILGGTRKQEYEDFATRYQNAPPYDTIGDDEALERYVEALSTRRVEPSTSRTVGRWTWKS